MYALPRMPRAYGHDHGCAVANGKGGCKARLIDIGSEGARVRLDDPGRVHWFRPGLCVRLDPCLDPGLVESVPPQGLDCVVSWTQGLELGLEFNGHMLVVHDLQQALEAAAAEDPAAGSPGP